MTFRPPSTTPRQWIPVTTRGFSIRSAVQAVPRSGGSSLPIFDWRKPYKDFPKPSVTLISNAATADTYLQAITSKRVTLEGDVGHLQRFRTRELGFAQGLISIADGEGVIVLHLAQMKRAPEALLSILSDPSIEKQMFGATTLVHHVSDKEAEFFDNCNPINFLDLRLLATSLYPRLERVGRGMPNFDFVTEFAQDGMGFRLETLSRQEQGYDVQKLSREVIDERINCCWLSHCASFLLRSRLEAKVRQSLGKKIATMMGDNETPGSTGVEDRNFLTELLMKRALASYRIR